MNDPYFFIIKSYSRLNGCRIRFSLLSLIVTTRQNTVTRQHIMKFDLAPVKLTLPGGCIEFKITRKRARSDTSRLQPAELLTDRICSVARNKGTRARCQLLRINPCELLCTFISGYCRTPLKSSCFLRSKKPVRRMDCLSYYSPSFITVRYNILCM